MRLHKEVCIAPEALTALRQETRFQYSKIPPVLRLGQTPQEKITLFKGARAGRESVGFLSHAVEQQRRAELQRMKEIVHRGDLEEIHDVFDKHTSGDAFSAFLSTSPNPEMAQVFAPYESWQGVRFTIYEVCVDAARCVFDAFDTGNTQASGEVLVLGAIYPEELVSVKILNNDLSSELLARNPHTGSLFLRANPDERSLNREVKDTSNWRRLS